MICKKLLLAAVLLSGGYSGSAMADEAFRNHRFDVFRVMPVNEKSIVFYGNSITNMNEWWEWFGSDPRILNRGNSGAVTQELIDNAESVISGHPAKVFIGIGTNDIGTKGINSPKKVAANIEEIIRRFREGSPETEIYVQSILPSEVGIRTNKAIKTTNSRLKKICGKYGITYIDLYDKMQGIGSGEISLDGLHITADGYRIWVREIEPYVGIAPTVSDKYKLDAGGQTRSQGMRAGYWSVFDVKDDDILMIGDEMIHGGEWHELMDSPRVKSRGMGWGYGGQTLAQWQKNIDVILGANPEGKTAPAAIGLYIGVNGANGKTSLDTLARKYRDVISRIRKYAPAEKTKIVAISLLPRGNAELNGERIAPFNNLIRLITEETENMEYADIFTPLQKAGVADADYIHDDYLYGAGYLKVAELLSDKLGIKK